MTITQTVRQFFSTGAAPTAPGPVISAGAALRPTAIGLDSAGVGLPAVSPLLDERDVKRRIQEVYELPAIPDMASRILQLASDPGVNVKSVVEVVELDPSLAAQIVRYARSPFFGYRGKIDSIQDAIARVLGFDMAMNIALGIASGKSFTIPADGPLGLKEFWRHSVYTATLTQALGNAMPRKVRPRPGMAYLCGLLHNIGFLLLGHLFKPEFLMLNKLVAANPDTPVADLEAQILGMGHARQMLGMGHAQIGTWLMQAWNMPAEVIVAVGEHHREDYKGEHAVFANLVLIAGRLLKRHGSGDAESTKLPADILDALYLNKELAETVMEKVLEGCEGLDVIASQIAA